MREDTVTLRQYRATVFVALFSPMSRLLPKAAAELAGSSGWVGPLLALPPLLGLMALVHCFLRAGEGSLGLGEALCRSLGHFPGKALCLLFALWLTFYGGFLLRSGAERLISTVYPSAGPGYFIPFTLGLCALAALGRLRHAFRCGSVILLVFGFTLVLIYALALPSLKTEYVWPLRLREPGKLLLSALPAMDVLSPWVYFTFLRGHVGEAQGALGRGLKGMTAAALGAVLLVLAAVGVLGPELAVKQQYPFFIMIKNLSVFHVIQRIEPLVVTVWLMTDFVCVTLVLLSAGEALGCLFPGKRALCVLPCAGGMLLGSFLMAPDALSMVRLSNLVVPGVNLGISFLLLPLLCLLGLWRTGRRRKTKKKIDSPGEFR